MRVLHVTRDFPPHSKGGISIAVQGLAAASVASGVEVRVASFDAWRPRANRGVFPMAGPERAPCGAWVQRLRAPDHVTRLAALWADFQPDWVHVHHGMLWQPAAKLVAASSRPRLLLSVHVDQTEMNRLRGVDSTLSAIAQAQALAEADMVHVPSAPAAAQLLAHHATALPDLGAKVQIIGLGHRAVGSSAPDEAPTGSENPENPASQRAPRLLAVGRFDFAKGTADLAEALPQIIAAVPDVEVHIVGGVPDNARAERRWRERLEAAGSAVQCLGWLAGDEVATQLRWADVAVFPSHAETLGLALNEALAAHVAVVATDVAGHRALLLERDEAVGVGAPEAPAAGVMIPPQRPARLARAAARLLTNPFEARRLAAAGQARAVTWAAVWPRWRALYASLAGS